MKKKRLTTFGESLRLWEEKFSFFGLTEYTPSTHGESPVGHIEMNHDASGHRKKEDRAEDRVPSNGKLKASDKHQANKYGGVTCRQLKRKPRN